MLRGHCNIFLEEGPLRFLAFSHQNLITYTGKRVFSALLGGGSYPPPDRIRFGTMGNVEGDVLTPLPEDPAATALNDPAPIEKVQYDGSPILVFNPPEISTRFIFALEKNEGGNDPKYLTEAGLFNSINELVAIEHFPAIIKTNQRRLIYEWTIFQQPNLAEEP